MTVKEVLLGMNMVSRVSLRILHSSGYEILAGGSPDFLCDEFGNHRIIKSEVLNNMLVIYVDKDSKDRE